MAKVILQRAGNYCTHCPGLAKLQGERADAISPMQERRRPAMLGDHLFGITQISLQSSTKSKVHLDQETSYIFKPGFSH